MKKTGLILYWFFSFVVVILAFRWVPSGVVKSIPAVAYHLPERAGLLYFHMLASAIPMGFIPFQLRTKFRVKNLRRHRIMGWLSVLGIYLGGLSLIPLALHIPIYGWGQAGFIMGALLWMGSASIGLYHIRTRDQRRHRWWMMITATIIFGAVTQRLALPFWISLGFPFKSAYSLSPWTAFSLNLALFFTYQYRLKIRSFLGMGRKSKLG